MSVKCEVDGVKVDIGEGYRLIGEAEPILEGDEFWCCGNWELSTASENPLGRCLGSPYRRKLPAPVEPVRTETEYYLVPNALTIAYIYRYPLPGSRFTAMLSTGKECASFSSLQHRWVKCSATEAHENWLKMSGWSDDDFDEDDDDFDDLHDCEDDDFDDDSRVQDVVPVNVTINITINIAAESVEKPAEDECCGNACGYAWQAVCVKPAEPTNTDLCEKGYRWLNAGEAIEIGDDYLFNGKWVTAKVSAGNIPNADLHIARRPIQSFGPRYYVKPNRLHGNSYYYIRYHDNSMTTVWSDGERIQERWLAVHNIAVDEYGIIETTKELAESTIVNK